MQYLKAIARFSFVFLLAFQAQCWAQMQNDGVSEYGNNAERNKIQAALSKDIARKRFALSHTAAYYFAQGNKLKEEGSLREAVKNYEYAIFLSPDSEGNYYSALAEIYYFLGQFTESLAYLKVAIRYPFAYLFDKMKAFYLLATDYFRLKKDSEALKVLGNLTREYQREIDQQAVNGLNIRYEYYSPAFFLLSLYYRNHHQMSQHPEIIQKSLQLGFYPACSNYFLYEMFQEQGQDGVALEYLKRAQKIDPKIGETVNSAPWTKTYDLYQKIVTR